MLINWAPHLSFLNKSHDITRKPGSPSSFNQLCRKKESPSLFNQVCRKKESPSSFNQGEALQLWDLEALPFRLTYVIIQFLETSHMKVSRPFRKAKAEGRHYRKHKRCLLSLLCSTLRCRYKRLMRVQYSSILIGLRGKPMRCKKLLLSIVNLNS